ncbi:MAG: RNB domain-containing ribonuclease [Desulfobacterales bacterium]|jgi:exoribonuclease-2|nr:RNB domain-containing ribonuclease [Desulfobacterales bacterium]
MESGNIVEFIDHQKIICAVVLEVKSARLRLLTEADREVNLSASRLAHRCEQRLDPAMGRTKLVQLLKETALRRNALTNRVDIKELWEVLNSEQEWIDVSTMTAFCFPNTPTSDQESAVVRAFFQNRTYFKFNEDGFFPYTEEQVKQMNARAAEEERKNTLIQAGGDWLKSVIEDKRQSIPGPVPEDKTALISLLTSYYLFEKESDDPVLAKAVMARAGVKNEEIIFHALVKLGIWKKNENIDLLRLKVPDEFPEPVAESAVALYGKYGQQSIEAFLNGNRRDLTDLPLLTIDGQATLDFDDALSIQDKGDHLLLGVHIADVGYFVKKDDPIDREALLRGSSIYMPDQKISMVPPELAENLCSLMAGMLRPAISLLVRMDRSGKVLDYDIVPSVINIKRQLTYYDTANMAEKDGEIALLYGIAQKFRAFRLSQGAVQISLPEINIWIDETGAPNVSKVNRESPGRMLVAEIMILANWLMAKYLSSRGVPAVFRAQPEPRERLFKQSEGTLFQNWMQRKHLSRFMLGRSPGNHSGLGLDAYVTATSPIRKYFDLITQRQIRAVLGMEAPYTEKQIEELLQKLEQPMSAVSRLQFRRNRYWLLKHLEKRTGQKEEAIVLNKRKDGYSILLTEYMVECFMPQSGGINLKPEDLIRITIQNINARNDVISVFLG